MTCPPEETRPERVGRFCGRRGLPLLVFSAGFAAVMFVAPEGMSKHLAGGLSEINQRRRSLVLALDDKQKQATNPWEKVLHKLAGSSGPSGNVMPEGEAKAKGQTKLFAIFEQANGTTKPQRSMRGTNVVRGNHDSEDNYATNAAFVVLSAALVSVILALIARSSRNHRERTERVRRVLEEEEAEIVEFYKAEDAFPSDNNPFERESHTLVIASGRSSSDNSLTRLHQETRDSQGDLYYSRVLSELACVEGDDEQRDVDSAVQRIKEESIVTDRITNGRMTSPKSHDQRDVDEMNNTLDLDIKTYNTQDTQDFNSTEADSTDSMSSLSYDGLDLDIESPPRVLPVDGCQVHEDVPLVSGGPRSADLDTQETYEVQSPRKQSRSCLVVDEPSTDDVTPPRSNVCRNRRRVSFCAQVQVKEIPQAPPPDKQELSFESYLYVMLLGIAGLILLFSLLPAHPSLSPTLATVTRDEVLERAEALLNGHWEVEL